MKTRIDLEVRNYIKAVKALAEKIREAGNPLNADSLLAGMDIELSDNCGYVKCLECGEYHNTCKDLCRECEYPYQGPSFRGFNKDADYWDCLE